MSLRICRSTFRLVRDHGDRRRTCIYRLGKRVGLTPSGVRIPHPPHNDRSPPGPIGCQNSAMLLGLTFAILASLGSGVGSAVEAFGVRSAAAKGKPAGDLGPLLHEPIYFIGLTVDLLGFVFTVIALQLLPLFMVQAVVASSVGVTALIVAASGKPLGRPAWVALGASLTGLVLLAISSQANDVPALSAGWHWFLLGCALPLVGLGALALRVRGSLSAVFRAIVVNGILGTVLFALALQRGKVTVVAAVTFTTNTVLPATIGIVFLGDQVRSGYALVATAGFLIAVSGAIALAQFAGPLPVAGTSTSKADAQGG